MHEAERGAWENAGPTLVSFLPIWAAKITQSKERSAVECGNWGLERVFVAWFVGDEKEGEGKVAMN